MVIMFHLSLKKLMNFKKLKLVILTLFNTKLIIRYLQKVDYLRLIGQLSNTYAPEVIENIIKNNNFNTTVSTRTIYNLSYTSDLHLDSDVLPYTNKRRAHQYQNVCAYLIQSVIFFINIIS